MSRPAISVVIPAFDAERFIGESIESALTQTLPPAEVIVVDDGSTDATAEVAAGYDGVRLLRQSNRGAPAARNAGFELASGELLAFHDADDLMPPDKLELQAAHLEANPGCGCVLGRQQLLVEDGSPIPFWARGPVVPHAYELRDGLAAPGGEGAVHTMTMLMRRESFLAVGPFDEEMRMAEDIDWLFRAFEEEIGVERMDDVVLIRRVHPDSLTQDEAEARRLLFIAFKKRIDRRRRARA